MVRVRVRVRVKERESVCNLVLRMLAVVADFGIDY